MTAIRPAGMTYERALEIAIAIDRVTPFPVQHARRLAQQSNGHRLPPEAKEAIARMTTAGRSASEIADALGVSYRTIERVRAQARKDKP